MSNIINIPKKHNGYIEVKCDLTHYLDTFRIDNYADLDTPYNEIMETYILIDKLDIKDMVECDTNMITLAIRIPGATRGALLLKVSNRNIVWETYNCIITVEYEITDIQFERSTCFDTFKVYSENIISDARKELINKKVTINIEM
jgi:hypothetical protein